MSADAAFDENSSSIAPDPSSSTSMPPINEIGADSNNIINIDNCKSVINCANSGGGDSDKKNNDNNNFDSNCVVLPKLHQQKGIFKATLCLPRSIRGRIDAYRST